MISSPFDSDMLERFFNGNSTPAEHSQIMEWLQTLPASQRDAFFDRHLSQLEQLAPVPGEAQLASFETIRPMLKKRTTIVAIAGWCSVAAALAGLYLWCMPVSQPAPVAQTVVAAPMPASEQLHYQNTSAQKQQLRLPDSSVVILSAGAEITYPAHFTQHRTVTMSGTVYFDVKKDPHHPFVVQSGAIKTTVLGTSFTITDKALHKAWNIQVHTGKVQVGTGSGTPILLAAGEKASYRAVTGMLAKHHPVAAPAPVIKTWTNIAFDHTPLRTVIKAIEEKYQVTVILKNKELEDKPVSLFIKAQTLNDLLEELHTAFHIRYEITGEQVIIY
ncbi:FecR family protein [Chitinophaga nivalis]|uniref:FecR domain-containing protein n=1 Tax=Chitinophaga nivalis TaxID=2991709 RepID=A0ABT3IQW5_9BACT|nr:FecR family protein [Chitinophaga nivalis]MCW3463946.1 FecR domain-containing protein [Chitinophaga nivalis]MCW3486364.1 FecR domain-containing protein [Chitinophaga nivalis]